MFPKSRWRDHHERVEGVESLAVQSGDYAFPHSAEEYLLVALENVGPSA